MPPMTPFSLLIKPVSFDCNLRCTYCFYLRAEEVYGPGRHVMPDNILEEMIRQMLGCGLPRRSSAGRGASPPSPGSISSVASSSSR